MQFSGSQTFCCIHEDNILKCSDLLTESWICGFEVEMVIICLKKKELELVPVKQTCKACIENSNTSLFTWHLHKKVPSLAIPWFRDAFLVFHICMQ